jgi:transglutaminase-like putative cysteine protease
VNRSHECRLLSTHDRLRRHFSLCGILLSILPCATAAVAGEGAVRSRSFVLHYEASVRDVPAEAKVVDLWIPVPVTDRNQTIERLTIDAPRPLSIGREPRFANEYLHVRVESPRSNVAVSLVIEAIRRENAGGDRELEQNERAKYLAPEPLVPLDGAVGQLAADATRGLKMDDAKAQAIYDTVVGMMKYDKSGTGWGRGDALYACDAKRGNCTDFHALVIGMARSVGIPARFAIGLPLPEQRGTGAIPGYHCWAELYVGDRGWVPVDASEAVKNPARRAYFFGHHDENRLEFSRGRQLTLVPAQQGPPVNFFVYPYAEVDGKPHQAVDQTFRFNDR